MDARILLVEDDPSIREVTAIGLRNAGFTIETAADGRDGLDRALGRRLRSRPAGRDAARASTGSRSAGRSAGPPRSRSSCSPREPTRSMWWSVSRPAPTTTSRSRSRCRSSSPASGPPCDAPADVDGRARRAHLTSARWHRPAGPDGPARRHRHPPDADRVRPARRTDPPRRPGPEPRRPARPDLGLRLPRRLAAGGRRDAAASSQGGGGPGAPVLLVTVRGAGYKAVR